MEYLVASVIAACVFMFCDETGVRARTRATVYVLAFLASFWGGFWLFFSMFIDKDTNLSGYQMLAYLSMLIIGGCTAIYMSKNEDRRSEFDKKWEKEHKNKKS